jgi:phage recombination protein Bet
MTEQQTLAQRPKSGLTVAMVADMTGYPPTDIALVSKTVAQGASLQELAVFLHACRVLRLDPLLRQAYWIRRKDSRTGEMKGVLQVGIDGFRAIAEGTNSYAGAEPPEFRGELEWTYKGHKKIVPERCRAIVWKIVGGHKGAFTGEAWWTEFVPNETEAFMWAAKPRHMLALAAERQALRRAFPALMGAVSETDIVDGEGGPELELVNAPEAAPDEPQPRRPRLGAEDYDRIYGPDDEAPVQRSDGSEPGPKPPDPEPLPDPEPEPEPEPEPVPAAMSADAERSQLWQLNRELSIEAARLKLRAPVLNNRTTNDQLRQANGELQRQINAALDQLATRP